MVGDDETVIRERDEETTARAAEDIPEPDGWRPLGYEW